MFYIKKCIYIFKNVSSVEQFIKECILGFPEICLYKQKISFALNLSLFVINFIIFINIYFTAFYETCFIRSVKFILYILIKTHDRKINKPQNIKCNAKSKKIFKGRFNIIRHAQCVL